MPIPLTLPTIEMPSRRNVTEAAQTALDGFSTGRAGFHNAGPGRGFSGHSREAVEAAQKTAEWMAKKYNAGELPTRPTPGELAQKYRDIVYAPKYINKPEVPAFDPSLFKDVPFITDDTDTPMLERSVWIAQYSQKQEYSMPGGPIVALQQEFTMRRPHLWPMSCVQDGYNMNIISKLGYAWGVRLYLLQNPLSSGDLVKWFFMPVELNDSTAKPKSTVLSGYENWDPSDPRYEGTCPIPKNENRRPDATKEKA